jgi:hypothetical protein
MARGQADAVAAAAGGEHACETMGPWDPGSAT